MIFKQYYLGCLAHASYLIADEGSRVAAVVDPQRDVDQYIDDARAQGLEIKHVFLTHLHADFVAGHLELRNRVGASIHLGARAEAEYKFAPMSDGDTLALGPAVTLRTLETPGHTPESISILVFDSQAAGTGQAPAGSPEPWAVLTGDTLFVGDVGRPDLRVALGWKAEDLGRMLYDSLHRKLLTLPDATRVYPAHGAGSLCGKSLGSENSSTVGVQRRMNYALQPMSRDEFINLVLADQPDAPAYFTYDAVLNTKERVTLDRALEASLKPLSLEAVLRLRNEGAQLLDVRDPAYFEAGHLAGAVNVGLGGQYATWAGTVLDRERPIVVIAEPGREYEAQMRLGRIGFDRVAGYLDGGMQALASRAELVARLERLAPEALAEELAPPAQAVAAAASGAAVSPAPETARPFILDVRSVREWSQSRIEGGVNIPLNRLQERAAEVPRDRRVVIYCASGYRSAIAASILKQQGFQDIADLAGGINAWHAAHASLAATHPPSNAAASVR
ncbi:MAG TPA: MBL fold metallo-hydrolase [Terriglobia bacterium]|nr:MBL fold metallo-hydrolase [Terriglobia bacterium]